MKKIDKCDGCRNQFYNNNNALNIKTCWSLKKAKVVTRYKIGWWVTPVSKKVFTRIKTLDCHQAPGRYALMKELPNHL